MDNAYLDHDRVRAGTFDDLADRAAHRWARATAAGHSVAVVAETNEDVDALNAAMQDLRARRGDLGAEHTRIAGTETAYVGGRADNQLYVVTDDSDRARDVLEQALTNDRADQPAIARRRELLQQAPRPEPMEPNEALARAERHLQPKLAVRRT